MELLINFFRVVMIMFAINAYAQAMPEAEDVENDSGGEPSILEKLFESADNANPASVDDNLNTLEEIDIQESKLNNTGKSAVVKVIDKTLGKLYILDIPVNDKKGIKGLNIKVLKCLSPQHKGLLTEGRALLEVYEVTNNASERIFFGWMFAQSPSVSNLNHPKFDVTLGDCK